MWTDLDKYAGLAAGLTTSFLWTGTSIFFTAASRRLGVVLVNSTRIVLAVLLLGLIHRLLSGTWVPQLAGRQIWYLALSGIVGLALGDQALFTAFVRIGPRISMLIMATGPIMAALFGWLALGETIKPVAWIGVCLTLSGVAWVVLERPESGAPHGQQRASGVLLAFIGAACQAGGLLLSKQGIGHGWLPPEEHMTPQAATLVRMAFAVLGMLPILVLHYRRQRRRRLAGLSTVRAASRKAGYLFMVGGAVFGPVFGVWMSLVACDRAPLGIALTLCSLPPVFILPLAAWIYKERISPRAIIGAIVAVSGTAVLFLQA